MKQIGLQNSRQRLTQRTMKEIKQRLKKYREKRRRQNAHLLLIPQESSNQISPQEARKQKQKIRNRESANNNRIMIKQKIRKIVFLEGEIKELEEKIKKLESQQNLCFNCKRNSFMVQEQDQSAQLQLLVEQQREDNYLFDRINQDISDDYHFERVFNSGSTSITGILFVIMIMISCMIPNMLNIQHQNGLLSYGHKEMISNRNQQNHQPIQWLAQRQSMTMTMGGNFDFAGIQDTISSYQPMAQSKNSLRNIIKIQAKNRLCKSQYQQCISEYQHLSDQQIYVKNICRSRRINQSKRRHLWKFPKDFICESLTNYNSQFDTDFKIQRLNQIFESQSFCANMMGINIQNIHFQNETLSFKLELGYIQPL